jgi:hypothetical protein
MPHITSAVDSLSLGPNHLNLVAAVAIGKKVTAIGLLTNIRPRLKGDTAASFFGE